MSAFAYVQSNSKTAASTTTIAYSSNTTAGSLLIFVHACFSGAVPTSLSDTQGNTWKRVSYVTFASSNISIWVAIGTAGGANTITQSSGASSNDTVYACFEYSAPSSYSLSCMEPVPATASVTTLATKGGVKMLNDSLVLLAWWDQTTTHTMSAPTGLTQRENRASTGGEQFSSGDAFPASISLGTTYAFNWTGSTTNNGLVGIVATSDLVSASAVAANPIGGFIS